jgi:long-subunit fatty acid transport protein
MKSRGIISLTITALLILILIPSAVFSEIIEGITLERLNILSNRETGARPYAMGGAYTAVSDDAFALLYNPAGLAQIKRKEISFGLHHSQSDITRNFSNIKRYTDNSSTSLGHISSVYPIPTYRGSLVFGFGVFRLGSSDLEYTTTGLNDSINAVVDNYLNQSGTLYKYVLGMGVDISPHISVGGNLAVWDQSIDFTEEIYQEYYSSNDWAYYSDDVSMDLDGISFDLGIMMKLNQYIRTGFCISSPVWMELTGTGTDSYEDNRYIWEPYTQNIEDEYTLPMRFRGGLSATLPHTLISADISYTDYSQTKHNGLEISNEENISKDVLKDSWDIRLGTEVTIPVYPLKIRAGYSYTPLVTAPMEEQNYIVDIEEEMLMLVWDYSDVVKNRQYYTFGVGGLIDKVLKIDLCVAIGQFQRETSFLNEKREFTEVILSTAYRF